MALGFLPKPGNIEGTLTWFKNGDQPTDPLRLTFYQMWKDGYRLRADVSAPKLLYGENITLLTFDEIGEFLEKISYEVSRRTQMAFDAEKARVCRIDYATNLEFPLDVADKFFRRYKRFVVDRLPRLTELGYFRSIYFGNESRTIRIYDKLLKEYENLTDLNHRSRIKDLIRLEYVFPNELSVKRFMRRKNLPDHTAKTVISPPTIHAAVEEMSNLLLLNTFNPKADFSFKYFYELTGSMALARKHSSFVAAIEALGTDFYKNRAAKMSAASYKRELIECQKLGF